LINCANIIPVNRQNNKKKEHRIARCSVLFPQKNQNPDLSPLRKLFFIWTDIFLKKGDFRSVFSFQAEKGSWWRWRGSFLTLYDPGFSYFVDFPGRPSFL